MTSSLEKVVAQKKEAIEAAMDMFERGAEVLASAVSELFPLCEAAAPVLRLALDNIQSKEVFYVKEQFLTVRNKLDVLSTELEDIDCEIKKGRLDSHYFSVEENIRNQFRKYMDILEAKPQFREVKTRLFSGALCLNWRREEPVCAVRCCDGDKHLRRVCFGVG